MPIWLKIIYLLAAGVGAGLISSMAGLASLISYPVLLSLGLPPVSADVTNTAALIFNGLGASLSSLKELRPHRQLAFQITIWAVIGGICGSLILAFAPASAFEKVVPFLILLAGILMLLSARKTAPAAKAAPKGTQPLFWRNLAVFLVGVYMGYFGASAGVILLSILSFSLTVPLPVSNALKNFACFATNILSLVIYAFTTKIYWLLVIPLGMGMFVGGYMGPIVVRHIPSQVLRLTIGVLALVLAAYLGYTAYF